MTAIVDEVVACAREVVQADTQVHVAFQHGSLADIDIAHRRLSGAMADLRELFEEVATP